MQSDLIYLNLYDHEAVRLKLKNRQNMHFLAFLGCFYVYVTLPHNHIGWARSIPFSSINSTNPNTNLWNLSKFILEIVDFEKLSYFESAILDLFFQQRIFLLHLHEYQSNFIG